MRQQEVNAFSEGLNLDSNPIAINNKQLSNALNATFITMNGNELVLLNDMGNTLLEDAYLPSGYVPVGMKEFGGVIYVASHNPIEKKDLIGCFPSPQRNIPTDINGSSIEISPIELEKFDQNLHIYTAKNGLSTLAKLADMIYPGDLYLITGIDNQNIIKVGDTLLSYNKLEAVDYELLVHASNNLIHIEHDSSSTTLQVYKGKIAGSLFIKFYIPTPETIDFITSVKVNLEAYEWNLRVPEITGIKYLITKDNNSSILENGDYCVDVNANNSEITKVIVTPCKVINGNLVKIDTLQHTFIIDPVKIGNNICSISSVLYVVNEAALEMTIIYEASYNLGTVSLDAVELVAVDIKNSTLDYSSAIVEDLTFKSGFISQKISLGDSGLLYGHMYFAFIRAKYGETYALSKPFILFVHDSVSKYRNAGIKNYINSESDQNGEETDDASVSNIDDIIDLYVKATPNIEWNIPNNSIVQDSKWYQLNNDTFSAENVSYGVSEVGFKEGVFYYSNKQTDFTLNPTVNVTYLFDKDSINLYLPNFKVGINIDNVEVNNNVDVQFPEKHPDNIQTLSEISEHAGVYTLQQPSYLHVPFKSSPEYISYAANLFVPLSEYFNKMCDGLLVDSEGLMAPSKWISVHCYTTGKHTGLVLWNGQALPEGGVKALSAVPENEDGKITTEHKNYSYFKGSDDEYRAQILIDEYSGNSNVTVLKNKMDEAINGIKRLLGYVPKLMFILGDYSEATRLLADNYKKRRDYCIPVLPTNTGKYCVLNSVYLLTSSADYALNGIWYGDGTLDKNTYFIKALEKALSNVFVYKGISSGDFLYTTLDVSRSDHTPLYSTNVNIKYSLSINNNIQEPIQFNVVANSNGLYVINLNNPNTIKVSTPKIRILLSNPNTAEELSNVFTSSDVSELLPIMLAFTLNSTNNGMIKDGDDVILGNYDISQVYVKSPLNEYTAISSYSPYVGQDSGLINLLCKEIITVNKDDDTYFLQLNMDKVAYIGDETVGVDEHPFKVGNGNRWFGYAVPLVQGIYEPINLI